MSDHTIRTESEISTETDADTDVVLGIDLGTRFSCVGIWRNNRFEVISDQFGNRTIPSIVSFYRSAKLVGHNALSLKSVNPKNTIYDIKRIIGRRSDDPAVALIRNLLSYEVIDDQSEHHNVMVQLDETDETIAHKKIYRPEEICSYILMEIKRIAETYIHPQRSEYSDKSKSKSVTKVVITVPAYFNDIQRQSTLDSAHLAGLEVLKIINEPTAAALAYGMGSKVWKSNSGSNSPPKSKSNSNSPPKSKSGGNIIVYDFGAGTLDVCLMNISNGVFRTLAVGGNTHLGGEDIDYLLMNRILIEFQKKHKITDLKVSKLAQLKLKNSVENAKKILSTTDKAVVCVDDFYNKKKLYHVLSKDFFEMVCNELFIMCMKPLKDVLDSAGMTRDDIDEVILVGGSTRIPKIQSLILEFFAKTNVRRLNTSLNPDEAVATGASIYGHIMTHGSDPFSENLVLLDITPLSLGVETLQKQMTTIIPRNTVIPTRKTKIFTTDTDNQDTVTIKIFEGERKLTKNNFHVGTFDLAGFESGPRGYPIIKITFSIDMNGILQVTAHETKSNVENTIKITSTWGAKGKLSKTDIDTLISESEKNEQIDMMYSSKITYVHKINTICSTILLNLRDDNFHLTDLDKKKIKADIKNNLNWLKNKELVDLDLDQLLQRNERLEHLYSPLIATTSKQNSQFESNDTGMIGVEIHGDDDDAPINQRHEKVTNYSDSVEYDKEEIKALKKTILDLGKNIVSMMNNPISNFTSEDIMVMTDYIDTVNIWLYTTTASTSIEFVAKINEINKITEDIMKKYDECKIFEKSDKFTLKDELQLTCITLNSSLKSNYFSLSESNTDKLTQMIGQTMIWLVDHQSESEQIYEDLLNKINTMCNEIYHSMHKMKILETIQIADNISESDSESEEIDDHTSKSKISVSLEPKQKITENIDSIIKNLPSKPSRKKIIPKKSSDSVFHKIDIDKLINGQTIKFKN